MPPPMWPPWTWTFASMTSDDPYAGSTGVASTPLEEKQWLESCANSA